MDFLKEIVKEIGDDFTKVAQDIDETERFIDTGSHIFNAVVSGSIMVVFLVIRLLPSLVKALLERLIFPWLLSKTFWIITLMVTAFILTPRLLSTKDYLSLVGLT